MEKMEIQYDNILAVYQERIEKYPNELCLICGGEEYTNREFDYYINAIAQRLMNSGIMHGDLVAVISKRSRELVMGVWGVLKCGAAYLPIDASFPVEKIKFILENSNCNHIIVEREYEDICYSFQNVIVLEELCKIQRLSNNVVNLESNAVNVSGNDICYVIYTSGSTGKSKGVTISHRAAAKILLGIQNLFPLNKEDRFLFKTNHCFDVSITEIIGTFFGRGTMVILEDSMQNDPSAILDIILKCKITHVNFVPTMLDVFLDSCMEDIEEKMKSIKYMFVAGEAFTIALYKKIKRCNLIRKTINLYGPTETTIYATYYPLEEYAGEEIIPIGKPLDGVKAYILKSKTELASIGEEGILGITGVGLANGYLNNDKITKEKFYIHPAIGDYVYDTGDVCKINAENQICFLGRKDHQVKIRGYRIELGEIENIILKHVENISNVLVIPRNDLMNATVLVAYLKPKRDVHFCDEKQVKSILSLYLPSYMIPDYIVFLEEFPILKNGKIDYSLLVKPAIFTKSSLDSNDKENKIQQVWADILRFNVGAKENLFEVGGNSILAIQIINRINRLFHTKLKIHELMEHFTIEEMNRQINLQTAGDFYNNKSRELQGNREMKEAKDTVSYCQKWIYFSEKIMKSSPAYNIAFTRVLTGKMDVVRYSECIERIVKRHDSLRTVFYEKDGIIMCETVLKMENYNIFVDISNEKNLEEKREQVKKIVNGEIKKVYRLSNAPLFKCVLIKESQERYIEVITMHHIISDGFSFRIFYKELHELYNSKKGVDEVPLVKLNMQYRNFAAQQKEKFENRYFEREAEYWYNKLKDIQIPLKLPYDYAYPKQMTYQGRHKKMLFDEELCNEIEDYAKNNNITANIILLSVFKILLFRYSRQNDIVVQTPIYNRNEEDYENLIGCFINTILLRTFLDSQDSFNDVLNKVKETVLEGVSYGEYPIQNMLHKIMSDRNGLSGPPLQILFSYESDTIQIPNMESIRIEQTDNENYASLFELSLLMEKKGNCIVAQWEYSTDLFCEQTIERMSMQFIYLLKQLLSNPTIKLDSVSIITKAEEDYIDSITYGKKNKLVERTVLDLVHEVVRSNANKSAIECVDELITYQELELRSNQLGNLLRSKAVKIETKIGVYCDRSIEYLIGIFGILKAGCVYVPLDKNYPTDRLLYILEDADIQMILSDEETVNFDNNKIDIINVRQIDSYSDMFEEDIIQMEQTAYIIYTSGSTGNPKGVMVSHKNLYYSTMARNSFYETAPERFLFTPSFLFDSSIAVIFGTLCFGGTLVMFKGSGITMLDILIENITEKNITHILTIPSLYNEILYHLNEKRIESLQMVIVAGEPCYREIVEKHFEKYPNVRFYNEYGPTEATVWCCVQEITDMNVPSHIVPIGQAIENVEIYILDEEQKEVPVGMEGELYIGGAGITKGYINNPEETAKRFLKNPFKNSISSMMYRTGDVVKVNSFGSIDFVGRIDNQIKIRGYRVELGEIEDVIRKCNENISRIAVKKKMINHNNEYLICFYSTFHNIDIDIEPLKNDVEKILANYMCPLKYYKLDSFPLLPNGKIDYSKLKEDETTETYVKPESALEKKIETIWCNILGISGIGVKDNFFSRGGNSLLLLRLSAAVKQELGIEVAIVEYFNYPTISSLCKYILDKRNSTNANEEEKSKRERLNNRKKYIAKLRGR